MPDDQATTPVPTGAHQGASESEPVRTGAHQPSIPVPTGAHRTIENPRAPSHFVAVATARERYSSAGFPRTEKAIRSYCHDGSLKFVTERGPNGHPKFWIDPLTIDEHHKELSQLYPVGESTPVPTGAHQQQLENEQGSIAIRSLSPQPTQEPAPADREERTQLRIDNAVLRARLEEKEGSFVEFKIETEKRFSELKDQVDKREQQYIHQYAAMREDYTKLTTHVAQLVAIGAGGASRDGSSPAAATPAPVEVFVPRTS